MPRALVYGSPVMHAILILVCCLLALGESAPDVHVIFSSHLACPSAHIGPIVLVVRGYAGLGRLRLPCITFMQVCSIDTKCCKVSIQRA